MLKPNTGKNKSRWNDIYLKKKQPTNIYYDLSKQKNEKKILRKHEHCIV